ncbi:hypothetical protein B296_00032402 [Ensete ventricosum]|uniref:Uncharacterized protein n=1 Tax=Ensete ventricosum TaxID=4639 RepID=A0A426ZYA4_ENSVE|nr:hypothetical protein B296_00032402 [Ensete ventricosum]
MGLRRSLDLAVHGEPGHAGVVIRERRADPKPLAVAPQAPHRRERLLELAHRVAERLHSILDGGRRPRSRAAAGGHLRHHGRRGPGAGEAHGQRNVGQMHGAGLDCAGIGREAADPSLGHSVAPREVLMNSMLLGSRRPTLAPWHGFRSKLRSIKDRTGRQRKHGNNDSPSQEPAAR